MNRTRSIALAAALFIGGCSSSINAPNQAPVTPPSSGPSKIQHVVILFQENRSFNNLFMDFPGAETSSTGKCKPYQPSGSGPIICNESDPKKRIVKMHSITLETCKCVGGTDIAHSHATYESEYDDKQMDGFDTIQFGTAGSRGPAKFYPYAFVVRREVQPYWNMASQYAIADHMFFTATTDSFVAHQEILSGTTALNSHESLTDTPDQAPWGCDAPPGTVTGVIFSNGRVNDFGGPFPCFTQYKTMADVLDAGGVSWKFYVNSLQSLETSGIRWNGFDAIKAVRYGPDWKNISTPNTTFFADVKHGKLPAVSWVIPELPESDHPASGSNLGPSWVTSVVNAVGKSQYWNSTAIVLLWDDWGGFYDPVPPPQLDYTSLGFRVPMILISPYAKRHYVSKTQYEFGSVLKFIEEAFGTGSLGSTDVRANSIGDIFDFGQAPSKFQPFSAPFPESYFLKPHATVPDSAVVERDGGPPD